MWLSSESGSSGRSSQEAVTGQSTLGLMPYGEDSGSSLRDMGSHCRLSRVKWFAAYHFTLDLPVSPPLM